MRRTLILLSVAAAAGVVLVAVPAGAQSTSRPKAAAGPTNFVSDCPFSHRAPDDLIVHPGVPGAAHSHDFFANTTTDAFSTYESLRGGDTSCRIEGDTAAYWAPTLYDGGQVVEPRLLAYYLTGGKDEASIEPFPADLRIVTRMGEGVRWACADANGPGATRGTRDVPDCPDGTFLVMRVHFPDCWDGRNLDSADHRGHMAFSRRGACPSTHPVPVPRLRMSVRYPGSNGGDDITLASGGPETAHADFFNAWNQRVLEQLVERCLNAGVHCGQRPARML